VPAHACGQGSVLGSRSRFPSPLPIWWASIFPAAFFFSPLGAAFPCLSPAIKVSRCAGQEAVGPFLSVLLSGRLPVRPLKRSCPVRAGSVGCGAPRTARLRPWGGIATMLGSPRRSVPGRELASGRCPAGSCRSPVEGSSRSRLPMQRGLPPCSSSQRG